MVIFKMSEKKDKKLEVKSYWNSRPCDSKNSYLEFATKEYFLDIEKKRYHYHNYDMLKVMGFERYAGKKLLEVGCGIGTDGSQFSKNYALYTGIDLNPNSVYLAKKRFEIFGLDGNFCIADAENLPFKDNIFDVIYSMGVLHHTPNIHSAINDIHRILKKRGELIIMLYHKNVATWWIRTVLWEGILRRKLLKKSIENLRNDIEGENTPITHIYTKKNAFKLFQKYNEVYVESFFIHPSMIPVVGYLVPSWVLASLSKRFGWHLIIKGIKQ